MAAKSDWPNKKRHRLVELYQSGSTSAECCRILKTSHVPARRYLLLEGVEIRPACKKGWSQEKIQKCVDLYLAGHSQEQIAEILQAGQAHVSKILAEQGIDPRHRWSEEQILRLVDLYQSGASIAQCCRTLSTCGRDVRRYLRQRKIAIRSHAEMTLRGKDHPNWKSDRFLDGDGYVRIRLYENDRTRTVFEHRWKMEQHIGRPLRPEEVVHHKDKNKQNNSLDNLQLFATNAEHLAFELKGRVPKWSEEGKARMDVADKRPLRLRRTVPRPTSDDRQSPSTAFQKRR